MAKWTEERRKRQMATLKKKRALAVKPSRGEAAIARARASALKAGKLKEASGKMHVTILSHQDGLKLDKFTVKTWGELIDTILQDYLLNGIALEDVRVQW